MKVKVEASQSQIGVDNILLSDINYRSLAVRLIITTDDNRNRTEIIISVDEALELKHQIDKALDVIQKAYQIGLATHY